jgi:N-acetylglucosaminyl-diphospho-decaprenol L-rhamnosyltransferase
MTVSAILVNYNTGDELRRALRSVADELAGAEWEALVVDNASSDGSGSVVDEFSPQARLVTNPENFGFATAVNQGLVVARGERVLIMNPDCRLVSGAVATMERALDADPSCALVGPRILNPDGSVQGSARGDPNMFTGLFGRTTLLPHFFGFLPVARRNVIVDDAADGESLVVDWVSGACMLARREALEHVSGFDERFFLYWEDADLCRRLRHAGYAIRHVPHATAVHRVGVSSRTAQAMSIREFHRSAYLYYATHVTPDLFHPKRWIARALLGVRCWWLLRRASAAEKRREQD